jgi:hypothetical protein
VTIGALHDPASPQPVALEPDDEPATPPELLDEPAPLELLELDEPPLELEELELLELEELEPLELEEEEDPLLLELEDEPPPLELEELLLLELEPLLLELEELFPASLVFPLSSLELLQPTATAMLATTTPQPVKAPQLCNRIGIVSLFSVSDARSSRANSIGMLRPANAART